MYAVDTRNTTSDRQEHVLSAYCFGLLGTTASEPFWWTAAENAHARQ